MTGVVALLLDLFTEFTGDNGLLNIARKTGLPFIKIQLDRQINIDQDIHSKIFIYIWMNFHGIGAKVLFTYELEFVEYLVPLQQEI